MNNIAKQKLILRATIGWMAGMLIGMLGGAIVSIVFMTNIWLKIFTGIGLFSASLATLYGLLTTIAQYKNFITLTKGVKDV